MIDRALQCCCCTVVLVVNIYFIPLRSECGEWTLRKGKCYRRFGKRRTWEEAKINCVEEGGTLVSIPDEETENFLKNKISPGASFWTGGTPCCEGIWRWLDGKPWSYTNWRWRHPKDGLGQRLFFNVDKNWITLPHSDEGASICQYQHVPDE